MWLWWRVGVARVISGPPKVRVHNNIVFIIVSTGLLRRVIIAEERPKARNLRGGQDHIRILVSKISSALLTPAQDKAALLRLVAVTRSRKEKSYLNLWR